MCPEEGDLKGSCHIKNCGRNWGRLFWGRGDLNIATKLLCSNQERFMYRKRGLFMLDDGEGWGGVAILLLRTEALVRWNSALSKETF